MMAGRMRKAIMADSPPTIERAPDEVAADYAGRMMEDGKVLDRFIEAHKENRTLMEKVRDAIRAIVRKLTGAEKKQAQTAEGKLTAALEAAAKQAESLETNKNAAQTDGEARFSLRNAGGKTVVWIENSSLSNKDLNDHKAVAAFIAQHIGEVYTIIESGQKVYIGKELPGEYTQSKYTSYLRKTDRAAARAKNKAVDGLGELIETATNRRWEKTRHTQSKDAKYGMYRYDSTFAFPTKDGSGAVQRVRAYDVELLIRNASDGKKYLYDIVNIKENTSAQIDLLAREAGSAAHQTATGGSVSATSVSQSGKNVNGRFSLKSPVEETWIRQAKTLQAGVDGDTMGATKHSLKEDGKNGRQEIEQAVQRGMGQDYSGGAQADGRVGQEDGGDGYVLSVRGMPQGQRPVHPWAEGGLTIPEPGSVAESEAHVVQDEYNLPVFVVKSDTFNQNHATAPAFSAEGQVFLRKDLPAEGWSGQRERNPKENATCRNKSHFLLVRPKGLEPPTFRTGI